MKTGPEITGKSNKYARQTNAKASFAEYFEFVFSNFNNEEFKKR